MAVRTTSGKANRDASRWYHTILPPSVLFISCVILGLSAWTLSLARAYTRKDSTDSYVKTQVPYVYAYLSPASSILSLAVAILSIITYLKILVFKAVSKEYSPLPILIPSSLIALAWTGTIGYMAYASMKAYNYWITNNWMYIPQLKTFGQVSVYTTVIEGILMVPSLAYVIYLLREYFDKQADTDEEIALEENTLQDNPVKEKPEKPEQPPKSDKKEFKDIGESKEFMP